MRGAASDGALTAFALAHDGATTVEARRAGAVAWTTELEGRGGPLVVAGDRVIATLTGRGSLAGGAVRGEPAAVVVALSAATGKQTWRIALETNEWVTIGAIARTADGGAVIGGAFARSLRVGATVVESGGRSDGFVLALRPTGEVAWLVRMGGSGADAVQGVAVRGAAIAIAGTYMNDAEVGGIALPAFEEKTPYPDAFVAVLDANGKRAWAQTFGGPQLEAIAGVVIDRDDHVVVAATVRQRFQIGAGELVARGAADGLVAWWNRDGSPRTAVLVGGTDFDGLRAITAVDATVIVGGFFSGTIDLGATQLTAGGGDDAFLAAYDANGRVTRAWAAGGVGREEIVTLGDVPGGFLAAIAYTAAATLAGHPVAAPRDPLAGAALLVRCLGR